MALFRRRFSTSRSGALLVACAAVACGSDATGPGQTASIASLTIENAPDTLLTRQSVRLQAVARALDGTLLTDRALTWTTSAPEVASVSAGGMITALAAGTATVRVVGEGISDSTQVVVHSLALRHVFTSGSISCGLEADGAAWCWGAVGATGFGNGSLDSTASPVPQRAALGHMYSSLALLQHGACGIETTGGVSCWGANESGQLGDGTTIARGTPAPVPGLGSVVQLAAGDAHVCARTGAGGVFCWGSNAAFQAGQLVRSNSPSPQAVALPGPAISVSAGALHTCAQVGTQAFCWGSDASRQLGHDTTYDRLVPVLAANGAGVSRTWEAVDASNDHTCARDTGGALFCWGILPGQGDNDTLAWWPIPRLPGVSATAIAGGWFRQCAITAGADLWCSGQTFPTVRRALGTAAVGVAVGAEPACVLLGTGSVRCETGWRASDSLVPMNLPGAAMQLAGSDESVCALLSDGAVFCWHTYDLIPTPVQVFSGVPAAGVFANSGSRVCIIASDNTVHCRRGGGETTEPTGGLAFTALGVGDAHTCGITSAGAAWCWGANQVGQLGDGTTQDRATPVQVQGGHAFVGITAGWHQSCGATAGGQIWCWGMGSWGQLGDDHRDESAKPVLVSGAPTFTSVTAGGISGCGLDGAGVPWCWPINYRTPGIRQVGGVSGITQLTVSSGACGLIPDGSMLCWGYDDGSFGRGAYDATEASAVASGNGIRFTEISRAYGTACGIAVDGATYCWGNNYAMAVGGPDANAWLVTLPVKVYGSP